MPMEATACGHAAVWACEWPAPLLSATASVDDGVAVTVSFFKRLPRKMHYATEQSEGSTASPGRVMWCRYASEVRPDDE
jgi:hypothetical protein